MPVLQLVLSDTTIASPARRRVWAAPALRSHSLAVLTLTRLHLADPTAEPPSERLIDQLEVGDTPDEPLPPTTVIDLMTVLSVRLDLPANAVVVRYVADGGPTEVVVEADSADAADELFGKLWHRLGQGYGLVEPDAPPGGAGPAAAVAGVVAVAAAAGAAVLTLPAPAWAGPAVGGVAAAGLGLALAWLFRRLAGPPPGLELVRR